MILKDHSFIGATQRSSNAFPLFYAKDNPAE
jgi:hypothetical protein